MTPNDRLHVRRLRERLDVFSELMKSTSRAILNSSRIALVIEGAEGTPEERQDLYQSLHRAAADASTAAQEIVRYLGPQASRERRIIAGLDKGPNESDFELVKREGPRTPR